jgi:UDP-N-acetylmuramyl pentapeptide synthase
MRTQHPFRSFEKVEDLIGFMDEQPIENNYVLIKGSRGIKLEKVLPKL